MITADTNFVIERNPKLEADNYVSKIFSSNSINSTITPQKVDKRVMDIIQGIRNKNVVSTAVGLLGDKKAIPISLEDIRAALEALFKNNKPMLDILSKLTRYIGKAELALMNVLLMAGKVISLVGEGLCSLYEWINGLGLDIPKFKFIDALAGLILIINIKCKRSIYNKIMNEILDTAIGRKINAILIRSGIIHSDIGLVTDAMNNTHSTNLEKWYPMIPNIITSKFSDTRTPHTPRAEWEAWDDDKPWNPPPGTHKPDDWKRAPWFPITPKNTNLPPDDFQGHQQWRRKPWFPIILPEGWFQFQEGLTNVMYFRKYYSDYLWYAPNTSYSDDYKRYSNVYSNEMPAAYDFENTAAISDSTVLAMIASNFTDPPQVDHS